MHSSFLLCAAGVVLSLCILQVQSASSRRYGDAIVSLYKNGANTLQDNIFLGDEFMVNIRMRVYPAEDFNDVYRLNITQYPIGHKPSQSVTAILTHVEDNLFNVTEVSPEVTISGRTETVLSRSNAYPSVYYTELNLWNSLNKTLPTKKVLNINLLSYRKVTNPGFQVVLNVQL